MVIKTHLISAMYWVFENTLHISAPNYQQQQGTPAPYSYPTQQTHTSEPYIPHPAARLKRYLPVLVLVQVSPEVKPDAGSLGWRGPYHRA